MLTFDLAKIVGTPTEHSWSQAHTFRPEEPEKLTSRGSLLAVLSLSGMGQGVAAVEAGREVISRLHEEYYGSLDSGPLEAIEQAVAEVVAEFSGNGQVEIVAAALVGPALYLAARGSGRALLRREENLGLILAGADQVSAASGYLEPGDVLLLGTGRFFALVSEGVLRAALQADGPQEMVEALAPLIHGKEESGEAAAVVAQVVSEKAEEVAKIETGEEPPPPEKKTVSPKIIPSRGLAQLGKMGRGLLTQAVALLSRAGPIYAKREGERSQRHLGTIALILALLLGASIFWGLRLRGDASSQVAVVFEEAQGKYEEATALAQLNPARSRALLAEARNVLGAARVQAPARDRERIDKLLAEIEAVFKVVAREFNLETTQTFLDLGLVQEGAEGAGLSIFQGKLLVLDRKGNRAFLIEVKSKSGQVLAGEESLGRVSQAALYAENGYVLGSRGIVEVEGATKDVRTVVKPDAWGEIVDFWGYAGNLYLLDRGENQIWKYNRTEAGFSTRQSWLAADVTPDFSAAVSMAIDGSIWVLTGQGDILKFTQGAVANFGVAGLDKPFSQPAAIYTHEDSSKLYVLDRGNTRVVVLAKSGEYDSQYVWPGIAGVTDLVVDEEQGKILLLSGGKIYEIGLQ